MRVERRDRCFYQQICVDLVYTIFVYSLYGHKRKLMQKQSGESVNRNRDVTINIRVHQAQRDLIDRAAEAVGKNP